MNRYRYVGEMLFWTGLLSFILSWSLLTVIWLLSPEGAHFNADTLPLGTALTLAVQAVTTGTIFVMFILIWLVIGIYDYKARQSERRSWD